VQPVPHVIAPNCWQPPTQCDPTQHSTQHINSASPQSRDNPLTTETPITCLARVHLSPSRSFVARPFHWEKGSLFVRCPERQVTCNHYTQNTFQKYGKTKKCTNRKGWPKCWTTSIWTMTHTTSFTSSVLDSLKNMVSTSAKWSASAWTLQIKTVGSSASSLAPNTIGRV